MICIKYFIDKITIYILRIMYKIQAKINKLFYKIMF